MELATYFLAYLIMSMLIFKIVTRLFEINKTPVSCETCESDKLCSECENYRNDNWPAGGIGMGAAV
jgi:hypothetical protein